MSESTGGMERSGESQTRLLQPHGRSPASPAVGLSFLRRHSAAVPLALSVQGSFIFFPAFLELIYRLACAQVYPEQPLRCGNSSAIRADVSIQRLANWALMGANVLMTLAAVPTALLLGCLSDGLSRKGAILIPLSAECLAHVSHICVASFPGLSPYYVLVGEALYGLGGAYMALFGMLFAHAAAATRVWERCRAMGLMEGSMGVGGTVGYFLSGPLLRHLGFRGAFLVSLAHFAAAAFFVLLLMPEIPSRAPRHHPQLPPSSASLLTRSLGRMRDALSVVFRRRDGSDRGVILAAFAAFGLSYFVFDGSANLTFYYLKLRVAGWTPSLYGYLKGASYAVGAAATLLLFPWLSALGVRDEWLTMTGLVSRMAGRIVLVFTRSIPVAFLLVGCDAFSRWGSAGLKGLMVARVEEAETGRLMAALALLQGLADLAASVSLGWLYAQSLASLPQLPFVVLAALMILPIAAVLYIRFAARAQRASAQRASASTS